MIRLTILLLFILSSLPAAQVLTGSETITFDSTKTGNTGIRLLKLVNTGGSPFTGTVRTLNNIIFRSADSVINIPARDSIYLQLSFFPVTNIKYRSTLLIYNADTSVVLAATLSGAGYFGDSYDATTYDKYDASLKTALTALVNNHTSLGYNTARDRMFETIDDYGGDTIECVYTGIKIYATTRTQAQNQGFDTEHTWPQGTFGQAEPMRSDLFHIYPTNSSANNTRGNYPFGYVLTGVTWTQGGSKLGKDKYNQTVFEPRDIHKGNVARSMLYFILRYTNNYGSYLDTVQENVFREWNRFDVVESRETRRNNLIAQNQGKRNPLIDHPDFVDRIYSFTTSASRPLITKTQYIPSHVSFDTVGVNDSTKAKIYILNTGTSEIRIDSVSFSDVVRGEFSNAILKAGESRPVNLVFRSTAAGGFSGTVKVYTSAGVFNVPYAAYASPSLLAEERKTTENSFRLETYPNPFTGKAVIRYSIPAEVYAGTRSSAAGMVTVKIYDLLGKEVTKLVNEEKLPGEYEINFYPEAAVSGMYICELKYAGMRAVKKMISLK
ncbi:MAG: endonuclease [Ignavibacteriaceae bacterium]|nr:endonuclease [Ignavibacteriaceae bacterium]